MSTIKPTGSYHAPFNLENACSIVAIRNAFDCDAMLAYRLCANHGYNKKFGMDFVLFSRMITKHFPAELIGVFGTTRQAKYIKKYTKKELHFSGISLSRFISNNSSGVFVLATTCHFTVVKNGELRDIGEIRSGTSVLAAWRVS